MSRDPEAPAGPVTGDGPRRANRWLDLSLGVAGLVVSAPVIAVAALAMRLGRDPGPVFHRATRVGEDGRPITVLKLCTMTVGPDDGPGITRAGDPRITPLGRVLRRAKLDELPQFINVIRGEMSLIGPRPEDPRYVDWSDPLHRFVFSARPGISGPSQIAFRHEEGLLEVRDLEAHYRAVILPAKLAIDARYLRERTVASDLRMLGGTLRAIVVRDRS